jgi:Ino eighty subunit 2
VDSSDDDDDDDEDAEGEEDEDAEGEDDDMADEDAEGEIAVDDSMDLDVGAEGEDEDALGEEDADGEEDDMAIDTPVPTIKVSKASKAASASKARAAAKASAKAAVQDNSDDDELSELDSDEDEIQDTVKVGGGDDDDEDAEGEDDDDLEATGIASKDDDEDLDSDDDGEAPDLTKMTKRQRARFEEGDGALLKLSDGGIPQLPPPSECQLTRCTEVQAKKHFTAEELSMRRAEMARRRRNLSEKRNEEVKACTRPSTSHLKAQANHGYREKRLTSCSRSKLPRTIARPILPEMRLQTGSPAGPTPSLSAGLATRTVPL